MVSCQILPPLALHLAYSKAALNYSLFDFLGERLGGLVLGLLKLFCVLQQS